MFDKLDILLLKGKEILPFVPDLAALRMSAFYEYPYLYVGDAEYEKNYLSLYTSCEHFFLLIVRDDQKVVGVTTGIPMKYEEDNFKKAFENTEYYIDDIFYIGETILLPDYRNKGLSRKMFATIEEEAVRQGYKILSFATVKRDNSDPLRPEGYISLDALWQKYGYEKKPDINAGLFWCEVGQSVETEHEMEFWLKQG